MASDLELLEMYARDKSEAAFAELVSRHLNLVHSAALRQVRSQQLAEEVVQSTFMDLARQAHELRPDTVLTAWLYHVTRRTAINVVRREARRQIREQVAYETTAMNAEAASDWTNVEAFLDEAMDELDATDRTAVLLRYFENKSLREVGEVMGASDNAAQKRISRAVERLREFFAKRGVAIGTSGIVVAISANAVQAAPIGLGGAICTAALISGTTLAGSAVGSITKAITMTTLQKACIAATFAVAIGTAVFQTNQASTFKRQAQGLQGQQALLAEEIQQLRLDRDESFSRLTALRADNERLKLETSELLRLRGEVAVLRRGQERHQHAPGAPPPGAAAVPEGAPSLAEIGKELGIAVVQGQPEAFAKLSELAKAQSASFQMKNVGLSDTQRGDLQRETFAPIHAAFKVIEEAAVAGNPAAVDAVVQSMLIRELKGGAIRCVGTLAGQGNEVALNVLLNPQKYDLLQSSVVGALRPAADQGNQKAIDFLAGVAGDTKQAPLWYMAARGLEKSAGAGNTVAIEALISLVPSENKSVRNAIIPGLRAAAFNQNTRAAEALRVMGLE